GRVHPPQQRVPPADPQLDRRTLEVALDGVDLQRQLLGQLRRGAPGQQAYAHFQFTVGQGKPRLQQALLDASAQGVDALGSRHCGGGPAHGLAGSDGCSAVMSFSTMGSNSVEKSWSMPRSCAERLSEGCERYTDNT